ncbi:MAG: thiol-disulfide isomerase/thioredoxin [Lentimonas sp.]|jgi:thiol-disulfide isomerase/thioredoxin
MKNRLLLGLVLLFSSISFAQSIKFKITGVPDTTVNLVKYYGKGLYFADTANIKGGMVTFDGSKQKPGILALFLPGQAMLEFILSGEEDIYIEADRADLIGSMKVKKSEENKVFSAYIQYLGTQKQLANSIVEERKEFTDTESEEYKQKTKEIVAVSDRVLQYQNELIANNKNKLVGKIVNMSMDADIPDAPKDENGVVTDSNFQYNYYRSHYFDKIDLKDDRLVNTSIFHKKLETYFGKTMMVQHWDTIIKYAYDFIDRLDPKSEMFKYSVIYVTTTYQKSTIMGMDKVYVMMADKYFCTKNAEGESMAFWMTEPKLEELCEKIPAMKNTVLGIIPPNIALRDTTDAIWKDFYSLKSEYTILYFWDPECGHCKKSTPKLEVLYKEKLKERNVEIFAVGKAIGEDFDKWKAFIKKNELTFINVGLTETLYKAAMTDARMFVPKYTTLEALNYATTYDIFSTPRIFVLDKDKKIIAKQLSISQLEDLLDRLQDKADLPKLFQPDPEEEEDANETN